MILQVKTEPKLTAKELKAFFINIIEFSVVAALVSNSLCKEPFLLHHQHF